MLHEIIIYTPMYVTFFWAILLFFTPRLKNRAKNFLGVFMLSAFLLYLSHAIYFNNYRSIYLYFDVVYMLTSLSVYPLYFLYIRLLTVVKKLGSQDFIHLIPAVIFSLLCGLLYLLMTPKERIEYTNQILFKGNPYFEVAGLLDAQKWLYYSSRLVFTFQVIFYLIWGSKLVVKYNNRVANFYSNLESKTIVWVNLLLISFVATSLISIVFNIIGKVNFFDSTFLLLIPSVTFSFLLFLIGTQGYMQNHTVVNLLQDEYQSPESESKKVNNDKLKNNLIKLFVEDQLFKKTDLKITHISTELNTNRTYVSNLINNDFSCSFSDFVNKYRIDEAKNILSDTRSDNYSLEYISETVGFGSLHTFIRVFKNTEGITPGRYREANRK